MDLRGGNSDVKSESSLLISVSSSCVKKGSEFLGSGPDQRLKDLDLFYCLLQLSHNSEFLGDYSPAVLESSH